MSRVGTDDPEEFPFILLGNKCDKIAERTVSKEKGQAWAEKIKANFFETSAKDLTGVEEAFMKSIDVVINKQIKEVDKLGITNDREKVSVTLTNKQKVKKDSCC